MVHQSSGAKITAPFHFTAQNWQETAANIMKRASVGLKRTMSNYPKYITLYKGDLQQ